MEQAIMSGLSLPKSDGAGIYTDCGIDSDEANPLRFRHEIRRRARVVAGMLHVY